MFLEFFDWFCNCIGVIFDTMKKFVLFDGFNYYNFFIALLAIPIFIKIFHFIMGIEDEEVNLSTNDIPRYDQYIGRHEHYEGYRGKHELDSYYSGKHESYGKHGSRWF